MSLLSIYLTFLKIGAFTFGGGYSVIPVIQEYVVDGKGWLSQAELADFVSLSQLLPGPIAVNAAAFTGTKLAGVAGAIAAVLGDVTPPLLIMSFLGFLLYRGKAVDFLEPVLKGIRPVIVVLIALAAVSMMGTGLFRGRAWDFQSLDLYGLVGFVIALFFYSKKRLSVIQLVLLSVGLGLGLHALGLLVA